MLKINTYLFDDVIVIVDKVLSDKNTKQELNIMNLARADGGKLISSRFSAKNIDVEGQIFCATREALELKIDELREMVAVTNGKLIMDYAGGYRTFYVNYEDMIIGRDNSNYSYCSFSISFTVLDPPFGIESDSNGVPVVTTALSQPGITSDSLQTTIHLDGSAKPKPKLKYTFVKAGDVSSLDFINNENGQQVSIVNDPDDNDVIIIDTENLSIQKNGEDIDFSGVFPEFDLGDCAINSNIYTSSGTTLDSNQQTNNGKKLFYGTKKVAQSFKMSANCIMPKLALLLEKIGAPTGDISVRIETDSAGSPSGTAVTNGTATITASTVSNEATWLNKMFTAPPVLAINTLYWIVLSTTGGDVSDAYAWHLNLSGGYADGSAKLYNGSWSALTGQDFCFKTFKNLVDQYSMDENPETTLDEFDNTTHKDATATTGLWAGDGAVKVSSSATDNTIASGASAITNFQLFEATDGTIVQVYTDGTNLLAVKSTDKGATWTKLDGTGGATTLVAGITSANVKMTADNNLHIGFASSSIVKYLKVTYSAGSWTVGSASNVTPSGEYTLQDFIVDSTGKVYVVGWFGSAHYADSWLYYSADGATFVSKAYPEVMANTYGTGYKLMLLNDVPYLLTSYCSYDQMEGLYTSTGLGMKSYDLASNAWTSRGGYSENGGNGNALTGFVEYKGTFYIAYHRASDSGVTMITHNGTAFGTPTYLYPNTNTSSLLFSQDANNLYFFIQKGAGAFIYNTSVAYNLQMATFNGTSWTDPATATIVVEATGTKSFGVYVVPKLTVALYIAHTNRPSTTYTAKTITLMGTGLIQSTGYDNILDKITYQAPTISQTLNGGTIVLQYSDSDDNSTFGDWTSDITTLSKRYIRFKAVITKQYFSATSPQINSLTFNTLNGYRLDATTKRFAQSFRSGFTGNLGRIEVDLNKIGTPGNVTIQICADNAGVPGTVLATQAITASDILANNFGWTPANFSSPASLTSGTTYWIVVSGASLTTSNYYVVRARAGNPYANGAMKYSTNSGSAYTAITNEDGLFKTFASSGNAHQVNLDITYSKRFL